MAEIWSGWIEHDGNGCPLPFGTVFQAKLEGTPGFFHDLESKIGEQENAWDWSYWQTPSPNKPPDVECAFWGRVVRYRVIIKL